MPVLCVCAQVEGIRFVLQRGGRGLIGDEMGKALRAPV
jgi:hypothetical protein